MTESMLATPRAPTFYFIGVTTGQSSSRRMFPLWMQALGRADVMLAGIDLEIHGPPQNAIGRWSRTSSASRWRWARSSPHTKSTCWTQRPICSTP